MEMYKAGRVVPALDKMPSIVGFEQYWDAYTDLATCRSIGMGEGPIPWTAIEYWARTHGLNVDDRWMLHRVIRKVDNQQLERKAAERSAKKPDKLPSSVRRMPRRPTRGRR